jgi:predicted O-methyltransferase YrrM
MTRFLGKAPLSVTTGIPGWETPAEEVDLISLASGLNPNSVIVEIGGEYGRSASQFAVAVKDIGGVKIFTVDVFPKDHHFGADYGGLLEVYRKNIDKSGLSRLVEITAIQGQSHLIAKDWKLKIDLLFVDGDHSYGGCKRDLESWVPHVKEGGTIVIHDYAKDENSHPLHHDVKRAVDEWHAETKYSMSHGADSLVWFLKPKKKRRTRRKTK